MAIKVDPIQVVADMGSSHIRVSVGRYEEGQELEILACAISKMDTLKHGKIMDIAATAQNLRKTIDEAERQSGLEIRNVDVSFGGVQISAMNSEGNVKLSGLHVQDEEINEGIVQAKNKLYDADHEIIHALVQQYRIDGEDIPYCHYPRGMSAKEQLTVYLHVLRSDKRLLENLRLVVDEARVGLNSFVFSGLASSYAASTEEERELGICVMDIGAQTTDYMVWMNSIPVYSGGLPIGGEQVSGDLSAEYATPRWFAEMMKCEFGALSSTFIKEERIELPNTGAGASIRQVHADDVALTIRRRYAEIFRTLEHALSKQGMRQMCKQGLVLTGGAAQIPGLADFVTDTLHVPVRIAKPEHIKGLPDHLQHDPSMMATIGLLKLIYEPLNDRVEIKTSKQGIIQKFKNWLQYI